MKFGIIAAGEGSRLRDEGVAEPKPLVVLNNETMLGRLLRIFTHQGASEIVVIVNELHPETFQSAEACRHRHELEGLCPIRIVRKTTPGSMYSFKELSPYFKEEPFCLTTVDTVFNEEEFGRYIACFERSDVDALMAVTDYVEDEKPLWVRVEGQLLQTCKMQSRVERLEGRGMSTSQPVAAFLDEGEERYISGGIYCMRPSVLKVLDSCMETGMVRMRDFQRGLLSAGLKVEAYPFSKILDVDHAQDIEVAEAFLREQGEGRCEVLCVYRDAAYAPQSVARDQAIVDEVVRRLRRRGRAVRCVQEAALCQQDKEGFTRGVGKVLNMARSRQANELLKHWMQEGIVVVNDPYAVLRLNRKYVRECCEATGIAMPQEVEEERFPQWVKRADSISAATEDDVCYVANATTKKALLKRLQERNIVEIECTEHVEGDLLKCYGVCHPDRGLLFFEYTYPKEGTRPEGRFGNARYNTPTQHYAFGEQELRKQAERLSKTTGICIFGGDAIVKEDGSMVWIDFNDFPSFAECRAVAAEAIEELLIELLER